MAKSREIANDRISRLYGHCQATALASSWKKPANAGAASAASHRTALMILSSSFYFSLSVG